MVWPPEPSRGADGLFPLLPSREGNIVSWARFPRYVTPSNLSSVRDLLCRGIDDTLITSHDGRFMQMAIAGLAYCMSNDSDEHFHELSFFHPDGKSWMDLTCSTTSDGRTLGRRTRSQFVQAIREATQDMLCLYDRVTHGASLAVWLALDPHLADLSDETTTQPLPPHVHLTARYVDVTPHPSHLPIRAGIEGLTDVLSPMIISASLRTSDNWLLGRTQSIDARTRPVGRACAHIPSPLRFSNRYTIVPHARGWWQYIDRESNESWPLAVDDEGEGSEVDDDSDMERNRATEHLARLTKELHAAEARVAELNKQLRLARKLYEQLL
ncbi:hypothetical protein FISHEDRAFT_55267 [Fistulina hepatica ATCC 64428]|uniref:Uncharacterized protein n=1 Tax=Fistulina hepatica ATCC 64428 TaxID=1128425 RepID=A0A0D7ANK5_9AGAR|nr:hypothetical protein FISHEDRAFT_55267 [Fistulina hepatica ATCC 64428]